MTKYKLALLAVASLLAIFCGACNKERNCRCTVTEHDRRNTISTTNNTMIINVDGIKCEDITAVGDEWIARDGFEYSANIVSCSEQ